MIIYKRLILTVFVSTLLVACGGGGGGSGSGASISSPCIIPQNLLAITAANAEDVVSEVKGAIQIVLALANFNTIFGELINIALINNPVTRACDISGTATISIIDNDMSGTITVGDLISANFTNCVLIGGTANGVIEVTITIATGTGFGNLASMNSWDFRLNTNLVNLNVSDGNITATVSGDINTSVSFVVTNTRLVSLIRNNQLTFNDGGNQCGSIENVDIQTDASNVTTDPVGYNLSFRPIPAIVIMSSGIAGAVNVNPVTPFSGMENFDDNADGDVDEFIPELELPTNGGWTIRGDSSTATVRVMPGDMVQILVDEDGDSQTDVTINTTWSAL